MMEWQKTTERIFRLLRNELPWVGVRSIVETSTVLESQEGDFYSPRSSHDGGLQIEVASPRKTFITYLCLNPGNDQHLLAQAKRAFELASAWENLTVSPLAVEQTRPSQKGHYAPHRKTPFAASELLREYKPLLKEITQMIRSFPQIASASAHIEHVLREEYYVNSSGAQIEQQFSLWTYDAKAIAQEGGQTQKRSFHGGSALCRQGLMDVISADWWRENAKRISLEAGELLRAPPCPSGIFDLLLDPDQMLLQIHESIGHPLELDRILGDERNYAGWSFVTLKDFGSLQFGSPLLNVTFNPNPLDGFASYAFDQSGLPAQKTYLIKDGILLRPLGGLESSIRSGLPAVANFRASSWNRAPIDRMANIDIEPGPHTLEQMIGNIELGIYMKSNSSWSIDDYRRKFQFSCEWAQMIRDGKLAEVVKNPGYRGEGLSFWRSLAMVGNESTFARYGSPYCGKGEPSQIIRVSHGSPACLFRSVEVFGYQ